MRILVLGGTGFVGRVLLNQLAEAGHHVTVLVRRLERQRDLRLIPNVTLIQVDHLSDLQLRKSMKGQDAVINLIGILHESGKTTFRSVHVDLVRKLAIACEVEGVKRLIHISALGASLDAPSRYLQSKAEAEALLMASDLEVTIVRPSVIFGLGDKFINQFASLLAITPMMPVVCPTAILSPVWVEDVARVMVHSLSDPSAKGQIYQLCGPKSYTLMELWQFIAQMKQRKVYFIPLSNAISRLMARVMGWMPTPMMTIDNYHSLQVPSVCDQSMSFDMQALSLNAYAQQTFGKSRVRQRYDDMRQLAGRDLSDRNG